MAGLNGAYMATKKATGGGLNANKKQVMKLDVPIQVCTVGYEGPVKLTIAGQDINMNGKISIVPGEGADPSNRVFIKWDQGEN